MLCRKLGLNQLCLIKFRHQYVDTASGGALAVSKTF